jgi:hypothetical protein
LPFTVADPAGNLLTTQDVSSAYFTPYWVKPTVTSGITDPLGGTTAYSLATADGTLNSSGILVFGGLPGGLTVTVSFWAKCTTGTLGISFGPADGLTTNGTLTTTWQKFSYTVNTGAGTARMFEVFESTASNTAWQIWRPRSEYGSVAH